MASICNTLTCLVLNATVTRELAVFTCQLVLPSRRQSRVSPAHFIATSPVHQSLYALPWTANFRDYLPVCDSVVSLSDDRSMPSLKQLTCSIELGPGNTPLKEYGARYYDGAVETLIAVPETAIPFSIHVASEGYIAPGLAVYVFIDGVYQCNRNKSIGDSVGDRGDPTGCNAEFRLRQKEEKLPDGSFLGRGWSFAKLDVGESLVSCCQGQGETASRVRGAILR